MKQLRLLLLMLPALMACLISGCIDDDITSSPSVRLEFSTDTVSCDTVFTELGTPTARLIVYNRDKKGVMISHIAFKNPQTPFRFNVDGQSGSSFSDIEIRGGDSIYVFIECDPPKSPDAQPALIEDQLQFVTNGNTQEVQVEAYGQNVNRLRGLVVENDMTLTAEMPYVVFDSLVVAPGARLTVEPGARLLFHDKAKMIVHGTLDAVGVVDRMIDMRGDRLDNVLPGVGYDIMAGQWDGLRFSPESFDNRMEYVNMRSTRNGLSIDSCADLSRQKLTLVNSWLHNSQTNVITSRYARVDAYGCVFSEAANDVVALYGGKHSFVQCTMANNCLFSAITGSLLALYHCLPGEEISDQPLMQADFENSIIYGLGSDLNEGDLTGSQVFLRYVLLKSEGTDDDNFINCLWGQDPLFYTIREDYVFDYRLRPDSPAIGAGDPSYVLPICLYDMNGLNRLQDGPPALGAYVYVNLDSEE